MKLLGWTLLLLIGCSCAHGKQVVFDDDSADNEVGWVCVPKDKDSWKCVSLETFGRWLRDDGRDGRIDM